MRTIPRIVIAACAAAIFVQSLILCAATGWRAFTRYPDPDLARMHERRGQLTSLFDSTPADEPPLIDNTFTFGLLPSPALSAEALSVLTIGGPALLAGAVALLARPSEPLKEPS